jgi:hypothetical protein
MFYGCTFSCKALATQRAYPIVLSKIHLTIIIASLYFKD